MQDLETINELGSFKELLEAQRNSLESKTREVETLNAAMREAEKAANQMQRDVEKAERQVRTAQNWLNLFGEQANERYQLARRVLTRVHEVKHLRDHRYSRPRFTLAAALDLGQFPDRDVRKVMRSPAAVWHRLCAAMVSALDQDTAAKTADLRAEVWEAERIAMRAYRSELGWELCDECGREWKRDEYESCPQCEHNKAVQA